MSWPARMKATGYSKQVGLTVTCQHRWPEGEYIVEVTIGGFDWTNPGFIDLPFPGAGETFMSAVEAMDTATSVAKAWAAAESLKPEEDRAEIHIDYGNTGGGMWSLENLFVHTDEAALKSAHEWAAKFDSNLDKCLQCGTILGHKDDWLRLEFTEKDGGYCSERCCEQAQAFEDKQFAEFEDEENES